MNCSKSRVVKKQKGYEEINGCTNSMPAWQVVAIIIILTIEILMFYLIPQVIDLKLVILYVAYALNMVSLIFFTYYYFVLVLSDPSDPRLKDPSYSQADQKLKDCGACKCKVSDDSHHCHACDRCVNGFDHHCVFLNNCIGLQNYSQFFKLLISVIVHTVFNMVIGLIMTVEVANGFRWVGLALAILSLVVFLEVTVLAVFHCYISFCLYKTTLQVLRGETVSNEQTQAISLNPVIAEGGVQPSGLKEVNLHGEETQVGLQKVQ